LVFRPGQPFSGPIQKEDGELVTRRLATDATTDEAVAPRRVQKALPTAGVSSNRDWDEVARDLERIRRGSRPTPTIEDL
jgi:hypothetical protein